jgi:F-type H+-transporting ATPase subunit delta
MNESIISVRYARAIFESALKKDQLDSVNQDMILISEICREPETMEFLQSPVIAPGEKTQIFHKVLQDRVEKLTLSLTDLLVKNGRESFLPSIARVFISETMKYRGITESVLTTVEPVGKDIRDQIIALVSGLFDTRVDLKEVTDPEIMGGFILRVGDKYIDASVRNKLNRIRKELSRSTHASD